MKEKFTKSASIFSEAIIQPVMFMTATGIILSVHAILRLEFMPSLTENIGDFIFNILLRGMTSQPGAIFCVGITAVLAKLKYKTDAAILGIITYLVFLYANNSWLTTMNRLAIAGEQRLCGTGQGTVFDTQVTGMGVFLEISLGVFVGWTVNRFGDVKLHKYLSPYSGTKSAHVLIVFATILFVVGITYVWPIVNSVVGAVVKIATTAGSVGFFFYRFLNRLLLPTDLYHFLRMPIFYTSLGGTIKVVGQIYSGALSIWPAGLGNASQITTMHSSIGYLPSFGSVSLPIDIAFALRKTTRLENRKKAATILIPIVTTALLAGVTESLEFLFLFLSLVLWLAHSVVYGLSLFITNLVGINIQFNTGINTIINSLAFPTRLDHQYLILVISIAAAVLEYFAFKKLTMKLNIPTLGREKAEVVSEPVADFIGIDSIEAKSDLEFEPQIQNIVAGLGGMDNIENTIDCYTRLRVGVRDGNKVNIKILKERTKVSGVVDKGRHIRIVIDMGIEQEREKIEAYIGCLKKVHT